MGTLFKMKLLLYKRLAKGLLWYVFLWITDPSAIESVENQTEPIRDLDRSIDTLTKELGGLVAFNRDVDNRLYRNPDLVSLGDCQKASENQVEIQKIKEMIRFLRKERFEQLLFALA